MSLKQFIKERPHLYNAIFMTKIYLPRQISFWTKFLMRACGIKGKYDFSQLKKYRNIHKGERCFIVGTGPSLTMEDLEKIKGEYSFSVNSIVLSFPDTTWRPTYYAIGDSFGYEKLKNAIREANMPTIFCGISNKVMTPKMDVPNIPYPVNLLDHGKMIPEHINKFGGNAFKCVYDGHSITYGAMELAVYMGFKEIILLGIDCDYSKAVNHVKAYSVQTDMNAAYLMRESYKVARKWTDEHGIKILNATRNAKLDVFEKVALEELLNK